LALRTRPVAVLLRVAILTAAIAASLTVHPASQTPATSYAIYSAAGRKALPFRTVSGVDVVALDQVATIFGLKIAEDTLVGGLTLQGRGQPVLLIPGQSFASVGPGRVVSLPAPVQRDRGAWFVPVEFIRQALGPALSVRVEIRRPSHVIVVGDVRVPRVTGRVERQGRSGRIVLAVEPPAPLQVTREASRLVVRFDALAVDQGPITGLVPEFVASARTEGVSLVFTLGPAAVDFRVDTTDPARIVVDLLPSAPPAPVAAASTPAPVERPLTALPPPGTLRTVVIDPGHGGEDVGARGARGAIEKDLVLALAQRLKAAIESRFGFRVLLTRDRDENVPVDRRTSLANNNKADLFISLHANASVRTDAKGAQVMSLKLEDYRNRTDAIRMSEPVPVVGGGTRAIDAVPWDLAQLPFAEKSATLAAIVSRHLHERGLPLFTRPVVALPLRSLVGTNMPAILVEVGFLSNADDERLLTDPERSGAIVEALLDAINDVRRGVPATASGPEGAP
jgi:N-acetylmuramoyl-L-alanine amidase